MALKRDLAHGLKLAPSRITITEVRGSMYFVFDVGGAAGEAARDVLSIRVAEALLNDGGGLYSGEVTELLDPRAGLLKVSAEGRASQVLTPEQLQQ